MIKVVLIDDEVSFRETMKLYLEDYEVEILGEAGNIKDGLALLKKTKPDVAFLDIQLQDGTSFEMLEDLGRVDFDIIFSTAYDQFAIKAFNFSAIGYLLKPTDKEELAKVMSRLEETSSKEINKRLDILKKTYQNPNSFEKISVPAVDGIYFVKIKDIVRCEASDNYTFIHMNSGKKITVAKTIKEYELMLTDAGFYRVHKSHLINLNYMKKYVKGDGGYIVMEDDKTVEVSRRRKNAFLERLKSF